MDFNDLFYKRNERKMHRKTLIHGNSSFKQVQLTDIAKTLTSGIFICLPLTDLK